VVDDCSDVPYPLPDFCEGYRDRITLLRNEKNVGPGLSRQRGLDLSIGEYVCFLDSDDYYHPRFLEKSLGAHSQHPEVAGTYTIAENIDTGKIREGSDVSHSHIMPALFNHLRPWPTCAWMWKRKYLPEWKPLRTNQDALFELEVSMINNQIHHISEVLCFIDKDTGANSVNLVKEQSADLNRNKVALYALQNRKFTKVDPQSIKILNLAILKRLIFTSGKLAGHGLYKQLWHNGASLFKLYPLLAILIMLSAFPILIAPGIYSQVIKRFLERIFNRI